MALGADRGRLIRLVLGQAAIPVMAGGAAGLMASRLLAQALEGSLYGVTPADTTTYGVVLLILGAVSLAACIVPALRAGRLNPIKALRESS